MRLDVVLTPGELSPADLAERPAVVIDVLRATSTIVQALGAGARSIYPVASIEDALRLANTFGRDEVLLCGERRAVRIEGFDLGNSPREFTAERVAGKILVMTTTNGTHAMSLTTGASRVLIASLLNLGAVGDELVRTGANPVLICAGQDRHFSLEDAVVAGLLAMRVMEGRPGEWTLNDGAQAALALARGFGAGESFFLRTSGGQAIVDAGLGEDLAFCAQTDVYDLLPALHDRTITLSQSAVSSVP